ncbi:unnamed protein product [Amoebophrya sp. A120]|nr:unnamed protein product [Amoebophrya sp. A120]|eukprot:GSA120T00023812001.1
MSLIVFYVLSTATTTLVVLAAAQEGREHRPRDEGTKSNVVLHSVGDASARRGLRGTRNDYTMKRAAAHQKQLTSKGNKNRRSKSGSSFSLSTFLAKERQRRNKKEKCNFDEQAQEVPRRLPKRTTGAGGSSEGRGKSSGGGATADLLSSSSSKNNRGDALALEGAAVVRSGLEQDRALKPGPVPLPPGGGEETKVFTDSRQPEPTSAKKRAFTVDHVFEHPYGLHNWGIIFPEDTESRENSFAATSRSASTSSDTKLDVMIRAPRRDFYKCGKSNDAVPNYRAFFWDNRNIMNTAPRSPSSVEEEEMKRKPPNKITINTCAQKCLELGPGCEAVTLIAQDRGFYFDNGEAATTPKTMPAGNINDYEFDNAFCMGCTKFVDNSPFADGIADNLNGIWLPFAVRENGFAKTFQKVQLELGPGVMEEYRNAVTGRQLSQLYNALAGNVSLPYSADNFRITTPRAVVDRNARYQSSSASTPTSSTQKRDCGNKRVDQEWVVHYMPYGSCVTLRWYDLKVLAICGDEEEKRTAELVSDGNNINQVVLQTYACNRAAAFATSEKDYGCYDLQRANVTRHYMELQLAAMYDTCLDGIWIDYNRRRADDVVDMVVSILETMWHRDGKMLKFAVLPDGNTHDAAKDIREITKWDSSLNLRWVNHELYHTWTTGGNKRNPLIPTFRENLPIASAVSNGLYYKVAWNHFNPRVQRESWGAVANLAGAFPWPCGAYGNDLTWLQKFYQACQNTNGQEIDSKTGRKKIPCVGLVYPQFCDCYQTLHFCCHAECKLAGVAGEYPCLSFTNQLAQHDSRWHADIVQVVTWNDYGEGTQIEPATLRSKDADTRKVYYDRAAKKWKWKRVFPWMSVTYKNYKNTKYQKWRPFAEKREKTGGSVGFLVQLRDMISRKFPKDDEAKKTYR